MSNGMATGKKIVSVLLMLAALTAFAGSVIYSLISLDVIKPDTSNISDFSGLASAFSIAFLCSSLIMIGGFVTLGLSVLSIVLSAIAHVRRPNVLLGIFAFFLGAVSFLVIPTTSFMNAINFATTFPSLVTSSLYTDFSDYFGFASLLFSLVILILAIVDLVKTGKGE